jgi:hypothetical protein
VTEPTQQQVDGKIESKLTAQVDRGATAQIVLRELDAAFKALEEQCVAVFRQSDMHDDVGRRSCRYYLRVLEDVRDRFKHFVRTGEDAHKELVRLKDPHPVRRFFR